MPVLPEAGGWDRRSGVSGWQAPGSLGSEASPGAVLLLPVAKRCPARKPFWHMQVLQAPHQPPVSLFFCEAAGRAFTPSEQFAA